MAQSKEYPKYIQEEYSSETYLNTLEICLPRPSSENAKSGLWLIYIHGGAWRDPLITATSFSATQSRLLSSQVSNHISGYASLNYRLSPYPSHPTCPSNPSDPARNAVHPTHINDVLAAILYLQGKYGFEDRYILIGHSCGATLALQVAMKRYWGAQYESTFALELNVVPPVGIVGVEGIYDVPALVKAHEGEDVYRDFVVNAFGASGWEGVSPARAEFGESWEEGLLVMIAHSKADTLVEGEQGELLRRRLVGQGWREDAVGEKSFNMFEMEGDHDEVWETGDVARAVERAVKHLLERCTS